MSWIARSDDERPGRARRCCRSPNVGAGRPTRRRSALVAAVAEVERDGDRRLGEPGPHRVVQLVAERPAGAVRRRDRRRPDVHDAGAALEQRVDLGDGGVGVGQREHRRGDEPALVVEAPVLLEPAVERRRGSPSWRGCRRAAPPRRRSRASGTAARAPRPCSSITRDARVAVAGTRRAAARPASACGGRRPRGSGRGTAGRGSPAR